MKGNWGDVSANLAVVEPGDQKASSRTFFTGSGFVLANAGKQSTQAVEFDERGDGI